MLTAKIDSERNMDIEFHWDPGSTNTYFAWHLLKPIARNYGARIRPHCFNLGYVFRQNRYALSDEPIAKMRNRKRDLMRWAAHYERPFRIPDRFPIKTSRILRAAVAMRAWNQEAAFMDAVMTQYWEQNNDSIAEDDGLVALAQQLSIPETSFRAALTADETGQTVVNETQSGLDSGVFGAPTIVIEDEIYWGKDRMEFIARHLETGQSHLASN
ncbi:MAG: DsbA family protein [Pseudomonadales bacterium]|nr:DsbA family protein [Pseudomonadales bacterium]